MRNSSFNKKRSIKHIVKVNIYYQEHRKRTEIDIISSCYNLKSLKLNRRSDSCIRVNIRELNKKFYIKLSILYTQLDGLY